MMTPETLAAAERVARHGARRAMLAARNENPEARPDGEALPSARLAEPASEDALYGPRENRLLDADRN